MKEVIQLQQLEVAFSIPIPEDKVLISKIELNDLRKKSLTGTYWNMKDLERRTGKKHEWIKENILYPSSFRKVLDVNNGGFVYYPEKNGQSWSFNANKMAVFLEDNFSKIYRK